MNTNNKENKPHPHADAIKAWADGAKIQLKTESGEWVDVAANWPCWSVDIEYRIKPKEPSNEPWKPKEGEKYFYLNISEGKFFANWYKWEDDNVGKELYRQHNCFRTKEEAESAIPRVEVALKGTTDVNANVGSNVGSPELDGKPLTDGEKELIKALRRSKIGTIIDPDNSITCFLKNGKITFAYRPISFFLYLKNSMANEDEVLFALNKIKQEQEATK